MAAMGYFSCIVLVLLVLVQSGLGIKLQRGVINGVNAGTPVKDPKTGKLTFKNNGQFPYMAAVLKNGKTKCGGVVIGHKLVLTAAHCVINLGDKSLAVAVGSFRRDDESDRLRDIAYVKEVIIHPHYDYNLKTHDLAMLVLKTSLVFNAYIAPISLPVQGSTFYGERATLLGWGEVDGRKAKELQKTRLTILTFEACKNKVKYHLDSSMICAIDELKLNSGHSKGDSGGPLFLKRSTQNPRLDVLIGVVSFSTKVNKVPVTEQPFIYANIADMIPWINKQIKKYENS